MTKVMTRTKRTQGTRPPVRHDTRRPGGTTPRTPAGGGTPGGASSGTVRSGGTSRAVPDGAVLTAPGAGRPSTTSAEVLPQLARPRRTRPAESPGGVPQQPRPTDLFADRLVAVLSGQRPVHCMLRHTAGRAYDELAWLAERGPLRTRGTRPVVRDIGYDVPRPGAIEAFARIGAGDQLRAMAFRLEQGPDLRWRCTAIELGGPRMPHTNDD
ncbi:Rv3235 family protein [Streptomyces sp. NPDC050704]|uniref:Rv3235 family protein n=1 Tax=Streptomyces sp. NPDC050704 TaxID=3157219 RepID=UPI00342A139F